MSKIDFGGFIEITLRSLEGGIGVGWLSRLGRPAGGLLGQRGGLPGCN